MRYITQTSLATQGRAVENETGKQRGSLRAAEGQILEKKAGQGGHGGQGKTRTVLWIKCR